MADRDPRFFLPISENYFDLSEAEQEAICLQMAETLIAALGAPDRLPSETPNRQGS
jgi:hypothetical protein